MKSVISTSYASDGHGGKTLVINVSGATCKVCTTDVRLKVYESHNDQGMFFRLDEDFDWKIENVVIAKQFTDMLSFVDYNGKTWKFKHGSPIENISLPGIVLGKGKKLIKFIVVDTEKDILSEFEPVIDESASA